MELFSYLSKAFIMQHAHYIRWIGLRTFSVLTRNLHNAL